MILRCLILLCFAGILTGCQLRWGMPTPGYGYPTGLAALAPRYGESGNYTYYPRYEAYYHHATQQFYYPNGKSWEVQPMVMKSSAQEVRATPGVPFQLPDHPSKYHAAIRQAFPATWTPGKGRFDELYPFGHSTWDLDRR